MKPKHTVQHERKHLLWLLNLHYQLKVYTHIIFLLLQQKNSFKKNTKTQTGAHTQVKNLQNVLCNYKYRIIT